MKSPRIVLINAPPRSGKNTLAEMMRTALDDVAVIGFSHHLKRSVHAIHFGEAGWAMDPDCFDAIKGEPQEILGGRTWRQEYIRFSEVYIKPQLGEKWFGRQFMSSVHSCGRSIIGVPDSGFLEEAEEAVHQVGPENVLLVRLHKEGCTYAGDSRTYIDLSHLGVLQFDARNEHHDLTMLVNMALLPIADWVTTGMLPFPSAGPLADIYAPM